MPIDFLETAEFELAEAVAFYENEKPGLGDEFLVEVLESIDLIQKHPEA